MYKAIPESRKVCQVVDGTYLEGSHARVVQGHFHTEHAPLTVNVSDYEDDGVELEWHESLKIFAIGAVALATCIFLIYVAVRFV